MKKCLKFVLILSALILLGTCPVYAEDVSSELEQSILETAQTLTELEGKSGKYILDDEEILPAGSSLSDWIAVVLAFAGEEEAYDTYLEDLEKYVTSEYKEHGYLDTYKATEYHRIALTVLALGGDPTAFGKDADGNSIDLIADGTYDFHAGSPGGQGSNGLSYALLALDAMDYEIPADKEYTREWMIQELLSVQGTDGGFALEKDSEGDVDITAMVLQALANYQDQPEVSAVIDNSLTWLSEQMTENGTFVLYESESSESVSQVVLALCALGIDPETDERFITEGLSVLDSLNSFRTEDGMYKHTLSEDEGDLLATQQALLALEAVQCIRVENRWILDYTGYEFDLHQEADFPVVGIAAAAAVIVILAIVILLVSKKKKEQERDRRYV